MRSAWRPPSSRRPGAGPRRERAGAASRVGVWGGKERRGGPGVPPAGPFQVRPKFARGRLGAGAARRGGCAAGGWGLARGAGAAAWPAVAGPGSGSRCGISCPARRPSCRPPPGRALRFRPLSQRPHPRPRPPRACPAPHGGRRAPGGRAGAAPGSRGAVAAAAAALAAARPHGAPGAEPARPQRVPRTRVGAGRAGGGGRRGRPGPGQGRGRRGLPCAERAGPSCGPPRRRLRSRPSPGAGPRRCVRGYPGREDSGGQRAQGGQTHGVRDFTPRKEGPLGRVGRAVKRRETHSEPVAGHVPGPGQTSVAGAGREGGRESRGGLLPAPGEPGRSQASGKHRLAS